MKKRSSIIAILLCAAMLTCACAARSDDKIEEPVQAEKQKVKVKVRLIYQVPCTPKKDKKSLLSRLYTMEWDVLSTHLLLNLL